MVFGVGALSCGHLVPSVAVLRCGLSVLLRVSWSRYWFTGAYIAVELLGWQSDTFGVLVPGRPEWDPQVQGA